MKLEKVQIVNYRSVREVWVSFDPPCRVLVGINESGKSNILNALSFLNDANVPSPKDDVRESLPDEDAIAEAYVRFFFRLDKGEANKVFEAVSAKILARENDPIIAADGQTKLAVKALCNLRTDVRYRVDLIGESKAFRYPLFEETIQLEGEWKKPSEACPRDFQVQRRSNNVALAEFALLRVGDLAGVPAEYLEEATVKDLETLIGTAVMQVARAHRPDSLFWQYEEENLLPAQIVIPEFAAAPDQCMPLKNMFILAGFNDVKKELDRVKQLSNNGFQNFLDHVAAKTTAHFRSVWKEYRDIEFRLRLEGDRIIPAIKEQNSFDFAKRSDGFKRFVTFLLMVSVNVKTDRLTNTLLLIDEPDSSLHPSGARYLRDELIRISSKNYVVYSTHSIMMIDSGNIGRHYIVQKKGEVTTIKKAEDSNIAEEEVLFNALGFSAFEILKPKNVIFEGWRDKRLFSVAFDKAPADVKKAFKDVGICHAKGVPSIKAITPIIELANRHCLIVSDADDSAKEQQKQYKKSKGFGEWKTYRDVDSSLPQVTGEDFLKNSYIVLQVNQALSGFEIKPFLEADLPADKGKLRALTAWLKQNGLTDEQAKDTVDRTKQLLFDGLAIKHIDAQYPAFLEALAAAL